MVLGDSGSFWGGSGGVLNGSDMFCVVLGWFWGGSAWFSVGFGVVLVGSGWFWVGSG